MNKGKIILSAVALFAIIGGSLAFKASKLPSIAYTSYTTTIAPNVTVTRCTTTTGFRLAPAGTPINTYTTVLANNVCPATVATFFVPSND